MKTILVKSYKVGKATAKVVDRRIAKSRKATPKNNVSPKNSTGCMMLFSIALLIFCLYFLTK